MIIGIVLIVFIGGLLMFGAYVNMLIAAGRDLKQYHDKKKLKKAAEAKATQS